MSERQNEEWSLKRNSLSALVQTLIYFGVLMAIVLLIQRFVIQPVRVEGSSMQPCLHNKDYVLLEKISYYVKDPKRFDVVVFETYQNNKNKYYVKRIIGLPGETVQIKSGQIYINGVLLSEQYGKDSYIETEGIASTPIVLGSGEYFVLGDNRNNSKDSRSSSVGLIKRKSIVGKAWCRIWPLNDISMICHN